MFIGQEVINDLYDSFTDTVQTIIIFFIMGVFTVVTKVSKSKEKINFKKAINLFYVNTVAGWGIFSLLTGYNDWFGNWPQKVFTIMTVVYVGFNVLEKMQTENLLSKLIEIFFKK